MKISFNVKDARYAEIEAAFLQAEGYDEERDGTPQAFIDKKLKAFFSTPYRRQKIDEAASAAATLAEGDV